MNIFILRALSVLIILMLSSSFLLADGGMWPLYDLNRLPHDSLKAMGLELKFEEIYNPNGVSVADAIVKIRGATASFVSAEGLMVTNHHVAKGAVQRQSTIDDNYLRDGFYAPSKEDEIPAIGSYIDISVSVEDITEQVLSQIGDVDDYLERFNKKEEAIKKIIKEAEKDRDVECRIASMYDGVRYILYTYFRVKDIRIVYAPPLAIGNYGDEIDNWMWPRHVGDFAFLRAYVAPDGSSAEYSRENVPCNPKKYLSFSSRPIKEGDFSILLGYPGKTSRYVPAIEIEHLETNYFPLYVKTSRDYLDIIERLGKDNPEITLRLSSKEGGISNYWKKRRGILAGFKRSKVTKKKYQIESEFLDFLDANPKLKEKYGWVLPELNKVYQEKNRLYLKNLYLHRTIGTGSLLNNAVKLYTWATERKKKDEERKRGYQERDEEMYLRDLEENQINLVLPFEKALLKYSIERILNLPEEQKIMGFENAFLGIAAEERKSFIGHYVDSLVDNTKVALLEPRMKMFEMSGEELEKLDDPLINLAISLKPELDESEENNHIFNGAESKLMPKLFEVYLEWKQGLFHPDANSTKRFNYGQIKGYSPRDGIQYDFMTSLSGVMEKETGEDPFIIPQELKNIYDAKDFGKYYDETLDDIPVNVIANNSGTNGNSGSPVLNGKGEIIGLDFDTSFDAVMADYYYDPSIVRSIICDSRYVLFILDKVYHLDELLNELTIHY